VEKTGIEIETNDRKSLYLREHIASGETDDGETFEVDVNINHSCMIFTFPEAIYTIGTHAMVDAVLEHRKREA
jgi:hypothetical protein